MADETFTWGSGGEKQTTSRRRLAEALLMEGSQTTPIKHWSQGLNRVAQAMIGQSMLNDEDARARATEQATQAQLLSHPALAGGSPSIAPASPSAMPRPMANTDDKIYAANEPSPLDPPSGVDRDMAVRTIIAESGNQPFNGQVGVGAVMRNRAVDGGYGGDTLPGVIQKPYAFEPHNTAQGRARMAAIDPNGPQYQTASRALDAAYFGDDPTQGATHFVAPKAQAALGRQMPAWAKGESTTIGDHVFYSPDDAGSRLPANAQVAQGFNPPGQVAAPPQQAPIPVETASYIRGLIANPSTRLAGVTLLNTYTKPRDTFSQNTDAQGNVWERGSDGSAKVVLKADKPDEQARPMTADERRQYGIPDGAAVAMTKNGPKAIGGGGTTINNNQGGGTDRQFFDEMVERSKTARGIAAGLTGIRNAREAIDGGAVTGFRADDRISLQKAAQYFGVPYGDAAKIDNSEVFKAAIASQIGAVMKAVVGNTNISDSDRRFGERAAGGSLDLNEGSIKRLLDIMERASNAALDDHQRSLDAIYPDAEKHKRERELFGVRVVGGGKAAGTTDTGIGWKLK